MIIIIEGIDRVGKTTLANKLRDKFNIPIYKQERIGGNNNKEENNKYINYGRGLGIVDIFNSEFFTQNIIIDRFHWTEAIYSLLDRENQESYSLMNTVEKEMLLQKDKYLIIYVEPTDIQRSSKEHGSSLLKHQYEFNKMYESSKMNKYKCSYDSIDAAIKEVERRLVCQEKIS